VTVIAANVTLDPPPRAQIVQVATAAELKAACEERFPSCDVLLMSAAVADFRPATSSVHKLKKDQGVPTLELEATDDVLSALSAQRRADQMLVGFAAEDGEHAVEYGREKLERKGLDLVVLNDISKPGIGFDAADNEVTLITVHGGRRVPRARKDQVARAVLDQIEDLRKESGGTGADARSAAGV
jgi:phosphopantothenoylcysteine decarboxylase/phosphopantothenate--cysteine ligase